MHVLLRDRQRLDRRRDMQVGSQPGRHIMFESTGPPHHRIAHDIPHTLHIISSIKLLCPVPRTMHHHIISSIYRNMSYTTWKTIKVNEIFMTFRNERGGGGHQNWFGRTTKRAIIVALHHFVFISEATRKGIKLMATSLNIHHRKRLF
jgi:hypothetical protein